MRTWLVITVLAVGACADQAESEAASHTSAAIQTSADPAPPPSAFTLHAPMITESTTDFHLLATGATPGARVQFNYMEPIGCPPPCPVIFMPMNVGSDVANAQGNAEITVYPPPGAQAGMSVLLEAFDHVSTLTTVHEQVVQPAGICPEDAFEDNDALGASLPFEPMVALHMSACPGDDDYLHFDLEAGERAYFAAQANAPDGEIRLSLYDDLGIERVSAEGSGFIALEQTAMSDGTWSAAIEQVSDADAAGQRYRPVRAADRRRSDAHLYTDTDLAQHVVVLGMGTKLMPREWALRHDLGL